MCLLICVTKNNMYLKKNFLYFSDCQVLDFKISKKTIKVGAKSSMSQKEEVKAEIQSSVEFDEYVKKNFKVKKEEPY